MNSSHSYRPTEGMVPNKRTAETIAEAVLIPIYGRSQIDRQKPFEVSLENGVWRVSGSLPKAHPDEVVVGGAAEIFISKQDATVLRVTHGE